MNGYCGFAGKPDCAVLADTGIAGGDLIIALLIGAVLIALGISLIVRKVRRARVARSYFGPRGVALGRGHYLANVIVGAVLLMIAVVLLAFGIGVTL